jgi:cytochrome P450
MAIANRSLDDLDLVTPELYATKGYPHDAWTRLRRESPVHRFAPDGYRPFWAVTKHEDVRYISTTPERFLSAPRMALAPIVYEELAKNVFPDTRGGAGPLRMLVNMDPPEHKRYRDLANPFFRPAVLRKLETRMSEVATLVVDRAAESEEVDFATTVATWHPLWLLSEILGVAEADQEVLLKLAKALFGAIDPEYTSLFAFVPDALAYFQRVIKDRRAEPRDDLASVLANATIGGEPMGEVEILAYFTIIATAGHDTTHYALTGGMHALIEHPDELDKIRQDPSLAGSATEEIVRWTSPVVHFVRTAVEDCELRGRAIPSGESLVLFYPSANRDEDVFEDPFVFRVDREPNPHLGFGLGEHYCLGAALARMSIRALLAELIPRLEHIELAGEPERAIAGFVAGVKHLPIRWRITPSA